MTRDSYQNRLSNLNNKAYRLLRAKRMSYQEYNYLWRLFSIESQHATRVNLSK